MEINNVNLVIAILLFLCLSTFLHAEEIQSQYQRKTLPDGSIEMNYSQSDGSHVNQIQRPDGTIETIAVDADGNKTIMTQHPNGNVESKTIPKKSLPLN